MFRNLNHFEVKPRDRQVYSSTGQSKVLIVLFTTVLVVCYVLSQNP